LVTTIDPLESLEHRGDRTSGFGADNEAGEAKQTLELLPVRLEIGEPNSVGCGYGRSSSPCQPIRLSTLAGRARANGDALAADTALAAAIRLAWKAWST
jgi:hypothetical protein